jgi:hypothetical protein
MKYATLLLCAIAFAQTTYVPHGPSYSAEIEHGGQRYSVRWQQLRSVCASNQANDCESRVLRVEVVVSQARTVLSRKHRVCETAGCEQEDPRAFVMAALRDIKNSK